MYFEYLEDDTGKEDLSGDEGGYVFRMHDEDEEERICPDDESAPTFRIQRRPVIPSEVGSKRVVLGKFVSMCATPTHLVLGTKFKYILRWNINDETSTIAQLEQKSKSRLSKVFASGDDVLVACDDGSNYQINFKTSKKPKPVLLSAMKGLVLTCMVSKGGKTVAGTRQGDILEVDLVARRATKVFTITDSKNQPVPILDMEMETFPSDSSKFLICAATSNKLYEFVTVSNMESSFKKYHDIQKGRYMTEICGNCVKSEIKFHSEHGSASATTVVWITESVIFMSTLAWGAQHIGDKVTSGTNFIPLDSLKITSMAVSPITILAFGSRDGQSEQQLIAINRLSQAIRHVTNIGDEANGLAVKLCHISSATTKRAYGRNFLLTHDALLEVVIINEDKELSGIYLAKQQFDLAKKFAKDATQRQIILATEAQHLFDMQMYEEAAKKYAELTTNHDARKFVEQTSNLDPIDNINVSLRIPTFEEIALKFVKHNAQAALLKFLITKLERTDKKQSLQRTILASWIVESMLEKIGREKNNIEERERTTATLDQFLEEYHEDLPPDSTIELISSHGQSKQLLYYANCIMDSKFVVENHIQNREFHKAVEELQQNPKPEDIYFFAPTLMNRATKAFTELLMKVKHLDSKKLLPALQKCKLGESDFVITYLEYLIDNHNRQPAIHNLLASLYSQVDNNEERLLKFIRRQEHNPIFDLKFVLRICHHEKHPKSCCAIYKILGLHESAVKVALGANELELAKTIARERDSRTSDKKLWLLIARHVIQLNDTSGALEIVRMSDLNIEDILPHLPDFVEMKDFKEDVLKSLENHNKQIERLKQDMKRYTRSADCLREDIERQTRLPATCTSSQLCDLSDKPILGHKFLLFPCTHVFRVEELRKKLKEYRHVVDESNLGAQCPLCGLLMIEETGNIFLDD